MFRLLATEDRRVLVDDAEKLDRLEDSCVVPISSEPLRYDMPIDGLKSQILECRLTNGNTVRWTHKYVPIRIVFLCDGKAIAGVSLGELEHVRYDKYRERKA